jgi:aspartyl-tRNA(Asn)/glutamyl-tRNA(Gln) amidotransferase subunit C
MAFTTDDVLHVAMLADLALSPDEVTRMATDLGAILAHVEQLNELDTADVPPTAHLAVLHMPLRADVAVRGLGQEEATAQGPRVVSGAFAVPKFVDE